MPCTSSGTLQVLSAQLFAPFVLSLQDGDAFAPRTAPDVRRRHAPTALKGLPRSVTVGGRQGVYTIGWCSGRSLVEQVVQGSDAVDDGGVGGVSEPEDELGWRGGVVGSPGAHAVDADSSGARGFDDSLFAGVGWQVDDGLESGGEPGDRNVGGVAREGVDEGCPAAGVGQAHAPEVAVEAAGGDEVGEGELVQRRRPAIRQPLVPGDVSGEAGRAEYPADAQCRGEGFADGAEGEHPGGG